MENRNHRSYFYREFKELLKQIMKGWQGKRTLHLQRDETARSSHPSAGEKEVRWFLEPLAPGKLRLRPLRRGWSQAGAVVSEGKH
jgi:hypothetical protein